MKYTINVMALRDLTSPSPGQRPGLETDVLAAKTFTTRSPEDVRVMIEGVIEAVILAAETKEKFGARYSRVTVAIAVESDLPHVRQQVTKGKEQIQ